MKMQNFWCCVPLAVTFSIVFHPAAQAVEQLSVGNNVRVACQNMAVHAAPSAMGVPVSRMEFGTSVSVQASIVLTYYRTRIINQKRNSAAG